MSDTPGYVKNLKKESVVQSVINCLTDAMRNKQLKPGDRIPPEPELAASMGVARSSVREAITVANACGCTLDHDAELEHAYEVSRMTDETISSMVQDVTHHRETEIRIITGAVCRLGREHGIATPCNDLMLQLVLAKQSIYLGR